MVAMSIKAKYTFPKALAGSENLQTCKYGGSSVSSSNAVVNCEPNMETGATYGLLNVTSCPAKYQTTNDLEELEKVEYVNLFLKNSVGLLLKTTRNIKLSANMWSVWVRT